MRNRHAPGGPLHLHAVMDEYAARYLGPENTRGVP